MLLNIYHKNQRKTIARRTFCGVKIGVGNGNEDLLAGQPACLIDDVRWRNAEQKTYKRERERAERKTKGDSRIE
jgi:hypothetical protein